MKSPIILLTLLILTFLNSCENDDGITSLEIEEARRQQVSNFYDGYIIPQNSVHLSDTQDLYERALTFQETPSQETLEGLKESWRIGYSTWKKIEPFNIGIIQESFIHSSIHTWPASETQIENSIESTETIDASYISTIGAQRKGYAAIEYLLFDKNESITIENFTSNTYAIRRGDYLVALTENLKDKSINLNELWIMHEVGFKTDVSTSVEGSQNRFVNAMTAQLEFIKNTKIEDALNTMAIVDLENFRSQFSKESIQLNLEALRLVYTGNFNDNNNKFGLEEYVSETLQRPDLNTEVLMAYLDTSNAFDAIPSTLQDAIINEPALLEDCITTLTSLIRLHKVDIASAANIIITFNDNDGD
jgi:predicted lipoprotein